LKFRSENFSNFSFRLLTTTQCDHEHKYDNGDAEDGPTKQYARPRIAGAEGSAPDPVYKSSQGAVMEIFSS
jgi:hypothetical protein